MKPFYRRSLCAAALPFLWLAGCGDVDPPTTPAALLPQFSQSSREADLSRLATFKDKPVITVAWAKKWIGPDGGELEFQGFAIRVPAGAVDKVTQFSIHLPVDPSGSERVMADFGPHGATFDEPVTIEFPFAGTSIEQSDDPTVLWWDASASTWVDVGGSVTAGGAGLQTRTDHFSTYGTSSTMSGTVLMSGG